MALSSAVSRPGWLESGFDALDPFRLTGTAMQPGVLLMCKILAVALLATRHLWTNPGLPEPFLPFIEPLDNLEPQSFQMTLRWTATILAICLLCNRWVRASAFLLGACLLLAVVSSKAYYGNNKTFVGLMLVLASLSDPGRPAYLVRWQLALVYFGAALNKLCDADWQSGLFFDHWAGSKLRNPVYLWAAGQLPTLVAAKIMCYGTIAAEFLASFGLLVPRLVPIALWCNALFQIGLLEFTGTTFTLFFYGMLAATLAFIDWPVESEGTHRPAWSFSMRSYATLGGRIIYSAQCWLILTVLLASVSTATWGRVLVLVVLGYVVSVLALTRIFPASRAA